MTQISSEKNLTTTCGNFYIGMTKNDAQKKGLDLSLFDKIDGYDGKKDGTLSKDDIIKQRDIECGKNAGMGLVGVCATTVAALCGGPIGWGLAALGAISSGSLFYKCETEDAKTDQYR